MSAPKLRQESITDQNLPQNVWWRCSGRTSVIKCFKTSILIPNFVLYFARFCIKPMETWRRSKQLEEVAICQPWKRTSLSTSDTSIASWDWMSTTRRKCSAVQWEKGHNLSGPLLLFSLQGQSGKWHQTVEAVASLGDDLIVATHAWTCSRPHIVRCYCHWHWWINSWFSLQHCLCWGSASQWVHRHLDVGEKPQRDAVPLLWTWHDCNSFIRHH